jgi:hypothetical protein
VWSELGGCVRWGGGVLGVKEWGGIGRVSSGKVEGGRG